MGRAGRGGRFFRVVFLWVALSGGSAGSASGHGLEGGILPQVIYGEDDRLDLYQVSDARQLEWARSTVALMDLDQLVPDGPTTRIRLKRYSQEYGLCRDEPFYEQKVAAFCSGSLVGPDLIMTAGHCISPSRCPSIQFVFGFGNMEPGQTAPSEVPTQNVYSCKEVVDRVYENEGADYALVRIDRPVFDRPPLPVNRRRGLRPGTPLVVIGHPAGLPTKVAGGARVRTIRSSYFVANLDTYGGNSGSAVFNGETGLIEGILVRGETDFIWNSDRSCRVSNRCADADCRGEDVTLVAELAHRIP